MSRVFAIFGTVFFSIGALAGLLVIVMSAFDGEWKDAGRMIFGTPALAMAAFAFRRSWQRANQEREFRREMARERDDAARNR